MALFWSEYCWEVWSHYPTCPHQLDTQYSRYSFWCSVIYCILSVLCAHLAKRWCKTTSYVTCPSSCRQWVHLKVHSMLTTVSDIDCVHFLSFNTMEFIDLLKKELPLCAARHRWELLSSWWKQNASVVPNWAMLKAPFDKRILRSFIYAPVRWSIKI